MYACVLVLMFLGAMVLVCLCPCVLCGVFYQVARMMEDAADAYERAGELYEQSKSNHETARAYVEAAKCRKTISPVSAIDAYGKVS